MNMLKRKSPISQVDLKGIRWDQQPLGKVPDREIAAWLGISMSTVKRIRLRLGIPAPKKGRRWSIDWDNAGLGQRPDAQIARELKVTKYLVETIRKERGIPACPRPNRGRLGLVSETVVERVLAVIGRVPKAVRHILRDVNEDDLGKPIQRQSVYRALRVLREAGRIVRERFDYDDIPTTGYRRSKGG